MSELENINSLIYVVESIISDIERNKNLDSIGQRYTELKNHTEKEIKLVEKSKFQTSQFIEAIYLPALNEFHCSLSASRGTQNPAKLYGSLLDGVGILKWYTDNNGEP
jgi:uncharacterized membrane protein